jgi:hypothetical protein
MKTERIVKAAPRDGTQCRSRPGPGLGIIEGAVATGPVRQSAPIRDDGPVIGWHREVVPMSDALE